MIKKSIPNIDHSGAVLKELQQKFIKVGKPLDNPPGFNFIKNITMNSLMSFKKFADRVFRNEKS